MPRVVLSPAAAEPEFTDERLVGEWAAELPKILATPQQPPWCAYAVRVDDRVVGFGSFKAPPDPTGTVEIAYLTLLPDRGRGIAAAVCAELVAIAFANHATAVVAHTLPVFDASTAVLRSQGFAMHCKVIDPDDGPVWRWRRAPHAGA